MSKNNEKNGDVKVTGDRYVFSDGIEILKDRVQKQVRMSKLNDFEKEQMELSAGKSYEMIIAEGLHRKEAAEREAVLKQSAELQARYEADRQRAIAHGKQLFDDGLLMIIHEGRVLTALEPIPKFTDDEWANLYRLHCTLRATMSDGKLKNALEILSLEKKYPEHRIVLFRKDS